MSTLNVSDAPAALTLPHQDHQSVAALFDAVKASAKSLDDDAKIDLVGQLCALLTAHAQLEEEIFYLALRNTVDTPARLEAAEVKHASAKELIKRVSASNRADPQYNDKLKLHVEEKEGAMLPKLRATRLELDELSAQLQARKDQLLGAAMADHKVSP